MRWFVFIALLLAVACQQRSAPALAAAQGCALSVSHDILWSNADSADTVSAHADGPDCARAVVTFSIRNARGEPLWAFSSTHYAMAVGDGAPAGDIAPVSNEEMAAFLTSWVDVDVKTSNTLPAWRDGDAAPAGETFAYHSDLPRDAYEILRDQNLPLACYAAGVETVQCLVIDPASRAASAIVAYGP